MTTPTKIPVFDTRTPVLPLREEIDAAVARVLDSGAFVLGPEVSAFEEAFAASVGTQHAIGVANGTEAITIALRALGVGPGDEVIVPSFTFYASAEAIPPTGATPVFCDVDEATRCVTAETVKAVMTPRTKAVVAVHLFGNVAPIAEIEALGVPVLEDAAQATGATGPRADGTPGQAGTLGTIGTFSFYPSKNLGAFGDGGAIVTDDAAIAEQVRILRLHGSHAKDTYLEVGYNSRLDAIQAAILGVQLPHLPAWLAHRRAAGARYLEALPEAVGQPVPGPGTDPAWNLWVITHPEADRLAEGLADRGIEARAYYRRPVHLQPAMEPFTRGGVAPLPATDLLAAQHLALPMSAAITDEQIARIGDALHQLV
ncbi:MAG: DegT/DnrJ/EryC1/StrS family aminotransferase [Solirubrobacteraceae bacterium]|nr:DegT/DnrJ/EryC1/StrS family aminotransferase [Solirubrobacteraceae bacterium]